MKMKGFAPVIIFFFSVFTLLTLCGLPLSANAEDSEGQIQYGPYHGPKKTIAVTKFDANGAFVAKYGGWDIGGGLAAQLVSELNRTHRFIVVDRADLKAVLREQQMGLAKLATKTSAPRAGNLLGAQHLIRGSVTQFEQAESGGGLSFGLSLPGIGGALSPQIRNGSVGMDLRIIDTTTGRIVKTYTVEKEVSGAALALDASTGDFNFGGDVFKKTALGKATRAAIADAVAKIIQGMDAVPWQALVASVRGPKVYINAGEKANIKRGDTLNVYRVMERITDPATQEVLGVEERQIGQIRVDQVSSKYSTGFLTGGGAPPKRGDILRLVSTQN